MLRPCVMVSNFDADTIDKILILNPQPDEYNTHFNIEKAYNILSQSTANVAPLTRVERKTFQQFWGNQFTKHETDFINNRDPNVPIRELANDIISIVLQ